MTNLTLLDIMPMPLEQKLFQGRFIPFLLITLALLCGAAWVVRRILLGRERARKVEEQRREDEERRGL